MKKENIFALDLGTTKFCIAGLYKTNKKSKPNIDAISIPADGMKRGMLSDFEKASKAINRLLEITEKQFRCDISKVAIGVAGNHLSGRKVSSTVKISNTTVTNDTLNQLTKQAEAEFKKDGREILHLIPLEFKIDNREPVENPLGFTGGKLEGFYYVIEADQYYLQDLIRLCNYCGIEITKFYAENYTSSTVIIDDKNKERGVAVADIGGGTTDGIVFQNGKPDKVFTLNVAGQMMTSDIAIGLNLTKDEAEKTKHYFGVTNQPNQPTLKVENINGQELTLGFKDVHHILGSRVYELATMLAKELTPYKGILNGGLLITGGGSEIKGLEDFLQDRFNIPVKQNLPTFREELRENNKDIYPAKYATVIGLLSLEILRIRTEKRARNPYFPNHYFSQILNWIKELS